MFDNPLRMLSQQNFRILGLNQIAYIRQESAPGDKPVWALHAADGTLLTVQDHPDQLAMIARTNDLAPVTLQ